MRTVFGLSAKQLYLVTDHQNIANPSKKALFHVIFNRVIAPACPIWVLGLGQKMSINRQKHWENKFVVTSRKVILSKNVNFYMAGGLLLKRQLITNSFMPMHTIAEQSRLSFRQYICDKIHLTDQDWQLIQQAVEYKFVAHQELLLTQGKVCTHLYFLHTGLLRYFVWKEGEDITKFFTFAPYLFTSQHSFSRKIPARENIQAIEDCHLLQISYEHLQLLYRQIPLWRTFIQLLIQQVQYFTENILVEMQTETAHYRYEQMLLHQPEMVQRIPLKYLASYLGIAPQSLSRIRKNILPLPRT